MSVLLQPLTVKEGREVLAAGVRAELRKPEPDWAFVAKLAAILAKKQR